MRRPILRPFAVVSAGALGLAAVGVAALPGAAQDTEPVLEKIALANEYLLVDTATDTVSYTGSEETQAILEGCSLDSVLSVGTLLTIEPGAGRDSLGYGKNGIGVSGKKDKSGTKCADVDAEYSQSLVLELGVGVARAADLDLEFKFGGDVDVAASMGGVLVDVVTTGGPTDASDNGPDSGDGDNYRLVIAAATANDYFDTLVLTATSGSFSFEGGGDGTVPSSIGPATSASVFEIVVADGTLQCEVNDEDGETVDEVNVIFTDCQNGEQVPYLLRRDRFEDADGQTRDRILFGVPESADNTYLVTIPWESEPAQLPLPRTQVAFFLDELGDPVYVDIDWCGIDSGSPYLPDAADQIGDLAGNQGACLTSQNAKVGPDDGDMSVVDTILLVGDPAFGRLR
jgi:hypothetical protein